MGGGGGWGNVRQWQLLLLQENNPVFHMGEKKVRWNNAVSRIKFWKCRFYCLATVVFLFRFVEAKKDRVTVVFSTVFRDDDDVIIGKVFMQVRTVTWLSVILWLRGLLVLKHTLSIAGKFQHLPANSARFGALFSSVQQCPPMQSVPSETFGY